MNIITSIAPIHHNTESQHEAMLSWANAGFKVYSLNAEEEIAGMKSRYPFVTFIPDQSCYVNKQRYGKLYVSITSILDFAETLEDDIVCIVNSDIHLKYDRTVFEQIKAVVPAKGFVVGKRYNYRKSFADGSPEDWGVDFFVLSKKDIPKFPKQPVFVMGQCWWDYWLPCAAMNMGLKIYKIEGPVLYHKIHPIQWSLSSWKKMADAFYAGTGTQRYGRMPQEESKILHNRFYNSAAVIKSLSGEKDPHSFIKTILDNENKSVILELGANKGEDTMKFLTIRNNQTHTFECDPLNFQFLRQRPLQGVKINNLAVHSQEGEFDFYVSEAYAGIQGRWSESGSLKSPKNHLSAYPEVSFQKTTVKVKTITLDKYCTDNTIDKVDFIWCDIQGNEIEMIKGARETLKKTRYLYTEYSNNELYEGQRTLAQIMRELPDFEVLHDFGLNKQGEGNILLKNKLQ